MQRSLRFAVAFGISLLAGATGCLDAQKPGAENPPSALTSEVAAAEAALERGDRAAAIQGASQVVAAFENMRSPNASDHLAAGRAFVLLGPGNAGAVKRALAEFDAATAANPANQEGELRAGNLFLEKYQAEDARKSFEKVLTADPQNARAMLGVARVEHFQGKADAFATARRSAQADPALADAYVLLSKLYLESEDYDSAAANAKRATEIDSASISAWSLLGATAWVTGDSATLRRARTAATKLQPKPASFYTEIAEAAVRQRRYAEAVELGRKAVGLDSLSVPALGVLGINALRIGATDESRTMLERAFALDAFNVWHKNTLDLLDKFKDFTTIERGRFQVIAPPQEAELLALYAIPLLESAYDTLATIYRYKPDTPVRLEFYRYNADFSVRTVGLTGLGALGVSFGNVLAMGTPSARERGEGNWGSTAWHELTHAFTLGASGHRVPRWLSEGMSVLEERRAGRGWGADASLQFIAALSANRLRPMSQLNDGFMRPRFPEEVQFSYYQASLFCEMVEQQKGVPALRAMLVGYRDGLDTPGVFKRVLGQTPEQVDAAFELYMRGRFAKPLQAVRSGDSTGAAGAFVTTMQAGVALLERAKRDSAMMMFERARAMFPEYGGSDGPSWYIAKMERDAGNIPAALASVSQVTTRNETAWDANMLEADLREKTGDDPGAMKALERLIWIFPYDVTIHTRLATLAAKHGDHVRSVRERRAIVALDPADPLDARYELARAMVDSGDVAGARRELLQVLEKAPSFEKAQTLLLQLRGRSL